jgi:NAD(P)-dependent dehydrogenase (short-subunit alcohol dehydrogenase family)
MSGSLAGRHALVTGAGRGIGRGAAIALAEAGAAVTLVARSRHELEAVAAQIGDGARVAVADVRDEEQVERALADAPPIDVLVTAAGLNRPGPTADYAAGDFDLLMEVNAACRPARSPPSRRSPPRSSTSPRTPPGRSPDTCWRSTAGGRRGEPRVRHPVRP